MSSPAVDCLIVGQGLAGTTLAWRLIQRGLRVLVVDRELKNTASRVAAGLMTPITGKRFTVAEDWHTHRQVAVDFYRQIEQQTGMSFFYERPALRWLKDDAEQHQLAERKAPDFQKLATPLAPDASVLGAERGGLMMPDAARLDVPAYLNASRAWLQEHGAYRTGCLSADKTELPFEAPCVIYCVGYVAAPAWQHALKFNPAKGETLKVRIAGLQEERVVHRGVWLVPLGDEQFLVGATYDRERLDTEPTIEGREELLRQLDDYVSQPIEVLEHRAAVRPVLMNRQPVARFIDAERRTGVFNGLGSKGTLLAPGLALRFAEAIEAEIRETGRP